MFIPAAQGVLWQDGARSSFAERTPHDIPRPSPSNHCIREETLLSMCPKEHQPSLVCLLSLPISL